MADEDPPVRSYHELPQVRELHRALGGYVEIYSQGVSAMRHGIETFLAPDGEPHPRGNPLFHILFAGMTAKPISDAFFGMAAVAAGLKPSEMSVRNVLRREWQAQTSFRNDLAHAEWAVGWEDAETGKPVPPGSTRIKNVDGVPTLTNLSIDTSVIIGEINSLIPLVRQIQRFAWACRDRQSGHIGTILDWFVVIEPKADEPRRVVLAPEIVPTDQPG